MSLTSCRSKFYQASAAQQEAEASVNQDKAEIIRAIQVLDDKVENLSFMHKSDYICYNHDPVQAQVCTQRACTPLLMFYHEVVHHKVEHFYNVTM